MNFGLRVENFKKYLNDFMHYLKKNSMEISLVLLVPLLLFRLMPVLGIMDLTVRLVLLLSFFIFIGMVRANFVPNFFGNSSLQLFLMLGLAAENFFFAHRWLTALLCFCLGYSMPEDPNDFLLCYLLLTLVLTTYWKLKSLIFEAASWEGAPPIQEATFDWAFVVRLLSLVSERLYGVKVGNKYPRHSSLSYPYVAKRYMEHVATGLKDAVKKNGPIWGLLGMAGYGVKTYGDLQKEKTKLYEAKTKQYEAETQRLKIEAEVRKIDAEVQKTRAEISEIEARVLREAEAYNSFKSQTPESSRSWSFPWKKKDLGEPSLPAGPKAPSIIRETFWEWFS